MPFRLVSSKSSRWAAASRVLSVSTSSLGVLSTGGSGLAQTANLLSSGSLIIKLDASDTATDDAGIYVVSSGASISAATNASRISADQTTYGSTTTSATVADTITVKPTGAAGSTFTVTGWNTTKTAIVNVLTVTINGASTYGVPSPAKSYVYWALAADNSNHPAQAMSAANTPITTDTALANATTTGNKLIANIVLNDAYGNPVTTAGALTATVSPGAYVSLVATGVNPSIAAGTYSTAVSSAAPTGGTANAISEYGTIATVSEATAGAGWSGTLTVSYNGVVIATKSGTISGLASKIVVTPNLVVGTGKTDLGALSYQAYDAAGNVVSVPANSISVNANSNTLAITGLGADTVASASAVSPADTAITNTSTYSGALTLVGGSTAGTAAISLKYTRADGVVVVSNTFNVRAGDQAASYTAKMDKSSYNQGDIATLTVNFLDSKGNAAASDSGFYSVLAGSAAPYLWDASLAVPMLTQIGGTGSFSAKTDGLTYDYQSLTEVGLLTSTSAHDLNAYSGVVLDASGALTIKFTVGSTGNFSAGNYNAVVSFPSVSTGAAQTVAYSVGSQGTSLNDVLKGIVALIASINKQIAALAKLVAPAKKK